MSTVTLCFSSFCGFFLIEFNCKVFSEFEGNKERKTRDLLDVVVLEVNFTLFYTGVTWLGK